MTVPGRPRTSTTATLEAVAPPPKVPRRVLLRVASVACGVQFGWALQLSLLTPYVQELGIPHQWASLVWLCGPLSGLVVQPFVGHMSDRCASSLGRRRPFIIGGALSIAFAVLLIGYSADIGRILGDRGGGETRYGAIAVYLLGFWLLDVGNNTTQGPCRALLADLTGPLVFLCLLLILLKFSVTRAELPQEIVTYTLRIVLMTSIRIVVCNKEYHSTIFV